MPKPQHKPGQIALHKDEAARQRLDRSVIRALELIRDGEAKGVHAAASLLNLDPDWLIEQLKLETAHTYVMRTAKAMLLGAVKRAMQVQIDLLDAESEKVRLDAAQRVLSLAGFNPDSGAASVNVHVSPGYIIDISPKKQGADAPTVIDVTPVDDDTARLMRDLG